MKSINYLLQKLHEAKNNNLITNFVYREHTNDICTVQLFYPHLQTPKEIISDIYENYHILTDTLNATNYISVIAL